MSMRIALVTPVYPPYRAGMAHVAFEEAVRLSARGHEVHVVTLSKHRSVVRDEHGVTIHRLRADIPYGKAGWSWELWRWLREVPVDVVHLHAPFFGCQEQIALWFPKTIPLVVTYHMDIMAHGFVKAVAAVSRAFFLPRLVRRADRIVVASRDYAAESWLKPFLKRLKSKLVEVPFGIDLVRFRPRARRTTNDVRCTNVLFVGALDRHHYFKGLPQLTEALAGLREHDWRLTVVGDGDLRALYEGQCRDVHIDDRVTFEGSVADEALPQMYAASDLFVLPSVDRSEAFGLVALEAQTSGVPVIVSDLPGVRTVIVPEETGLLVPPMDVDALREALRMLMEDVPRRKAMGVKAREHARRFSWDAHVGILERVYAEAINAHHGRLR